MHFLGFVHSLLNHDFFSITDNNYKWLSTVGVEKEKGKPSIFHPFILLFLQVNSRAKEEKQKK